MNVTVMISEGRWESLRPFITRQFSIFGKALALPLSSVDVFVVSLKEARRIKAESLHRGLRVSPESTERGFNVLAYPHPKGFPCPDRRGNFLGEIYISPDFIKAEGQSVEGMLAHGFLHLLGYDHEKKNDRIRMEAQEKKLVRRLSLNIVVAGRRRKVG